MRRLFLVLVAIPDENDGGASILSLQNKIYRAVLKRPLPAALDGNESAPMEALGPPGAYRRLEGVDEG
jgi:hypothetical protein